MINRLMILPPIHLRRKEDAMKTLLVFASTHHGNTKKVVERMAQVLSADMADITRNSTPDLSGYDLVGLASGVYFNTLHKDIVRLAEQGRFLPGQRVFLADTCGVGYINYCAGVRKKLAGRGIPVLGCFQCRGDDTFGIWGRLGGIAKGHPSGKDLDRAASFARDVLEKAQAEKTDL